MRADVRAFQSRNSTGVRGMTLRPDDEVISLSILHRSGATQDEREAYLRVAPWKPENDREATLDPERIAELAEVEQFILTVCANGYGKRQLRLWIPPHQPRRTGHHQYRQSRAQRGCRRKLPRSNGDQLMLVTDQAKLIRMPLDDLRVIGRNSAGVRLFDVAPGEHVVSAARIEESEDEAEAVLIEGIEPEIAPDDGAIVGDDAAAGPEDGQ